MLWSKVYSMSPNENAELEQFLKDTITKRYIVESKSPIALYVFFIKKKDGKLHFIQDYQKLKNLTIKNCYLLLLASDIVKKLKGAQIFTKFNIYWSYNNVQIKKGDKWKAAFVINRGLFKPRVMYFGLYNSPATFQALMNYIFANLIAKSKVAVYLNDILI